MKAIVTGHTRGLGAAFAEELLVRSFSVLAIARSRNDALAQRHAGALTQAQVDLSDPSALERWLAGGALRDFIAGAKAVVLINNAGTAEPIGPVQKLDAAAVGKAVGLNVATPLMLSSAVAAAARDAGDLRIMHLSSGAARNPYPGWSLYCASKAALDQHAKAAALDKTPHLRICSLAPGTIDTDMQAAVRSAPAEDFPLRAKFEGLKRDGQLTSPQECAQRAIDYLLSERFGAVPTVDLRELGK